MQVYLFEENRRLLLAFIFSILLHLSLFISLELRPNFSWPRQKEEKAKSADIIRFDLIETEPPFVMETPEVDKEEVPSKPTSILSDKNITARDMLEKTEDINELPYVERKSKIKDLRKSIPSVASMPLKEMKPQPELKPQPRVEQSKTIPAPPEEKGKEKTGIEMLTSKETLPQELSPQQEIPPQKEMQEQKEQVASVPKDILRIPTTDEPFSNAQSFGNVTFSAKKHDAAPYIIKMKRKIEEYWAPPVIFTYYGLTSGETVVNFKIMPDGEVKDVNVIREKGDESLKKSSLQAVLDASPFDPIPPKFLEGEDEKYLGITFTFYYIIDEPIEDNI